MARFELPHRSPRRPGFWRILIPCAQGSGCLFTIQASCPAACTGFYAGIVRNGVCLWESGRIRPPAERAAFGIRRRGIPHHGAGISIRRSNASKIFNIHAVLAKTAPAGIVPMDKAASRVHGSICLIAYLYTHSSCRHWRGARSAHKTDDLDPGDGHQTFYHHLVQVGDEPGDLLFRIDDAEHDGSIL